MTPNIIQGRITVARKGMGFVVPDGAQRRANDIYISPDHLNQALDGDTVSVELFPERQGPKGPSLAGKVLKVIERSRDTFVGVAYEENGVLMVRPDQKRIHVPFKIIGGLIEGALNMKVVITMTEWKSGAAFPEATISSIIGEPGLHETEMRAFVFARNFAMGFPEAVEAEADEMHKKQDELFKEAEAEIASGRRRDMRGITTFTIDPADAKDFDDAISLRTLPDGNIEAGIHIADVSWYVRPGTELDKEALKRATSIYLVDRTIPMLPEVLSNDLCSLMPHVDRLAMSAIFTLSPSFEVIDEWYGETMINPDHRFSYEDAQEVLNTGEGPLKETLFLARDIAKKIRADRAQEGAIAFEQDEVKFILDENMQPIKIYKKQRQETNLLIEDFMLLANKKVAEFVSKRIEKKQNPAFFVYRIHDLPDTERIEELAIFLKALGHDLKHNKGQVKGTSINLMFGGLDGRPEEALIKTATIRSMAKAVYSTKNVGHFGLAFPFYTHFTSPIRRYPDVMVHRLVKSHLGIDPISSREAGAFENMAIRSSEREVAAVEAERDSIKYKQVEYMKNHIGESFDAVVSGVSDAGMFVEEVNTRSEGLIRMKDLPDFFTLDKKNFRIVGERTKKTFSLGDKIKVKLMSANLEERMLDFSLVP